MVTTSVVGQLAGECTDWIIALRSYREKFQRHKNELPAISSKQFQKDVLLEIEHLDNQLHIQLINIHDLKQAIKKHVNNISRERLPDNGHHSDDVLARHEYLYDEFQRLDTTLHIIGREYERFTRHIGAG